MRNEPHSPEWHVCRGNICEYWELLSRVENDQLVSDQADLVDLLSARYGFTPQEAREQIDLFFIHQS